MGVTEGMLGRNNETMREKGWRTEEGERLVQTAAAGTVITLPFIQ